MVLRLAILIPALSTVPGYIAVVGGREAILTHIGLCVGSPVKGVCYQSAGRDHAVSDRKFPPVCGQVHAAGEELIVLEILGEIQSQIQPVAVLQLQHRLPFVQPVGCPLTLFRPNITEVNGMANQFAGLVVLVENTRQLGQAAVHLQCDALAEALCL